MNSVGASVDERSPSVSRRLPTTASDRYDSPTTVCDSSATVDDQLQRSASSTPPRRRDSLDVDDESSSLLRWPTRDVDRAIAEGQRAGEQIENVLSARETGAHQRALEETEKGGAPRVSGSQRASDEGTERTGRRQGARCPETEPRRWGAVFDTDDDAPPCRLQRSATLPRRWRHADDRMAEIRETGEHPSESGAAGRAADTLGAARRKLLPDIDDDSESTAATVQSLSGGTANGGVQLAASWQQRLPETRPTSLTRGSPDGASWQQPRVTESLGGSGVLVDGSRQSDSPSTSRPTSEDFDDVSTSSSSRDEGFESAVDCGSANAGPCAVRGYPDLEVQCPSSPSPGSTPRGEAATPCDAEEASVSAGTMFFARSNDSLVPRGELVLSGDTIDVDHYDEPPPPNPADASTVAPAPRTPASAGNKKSSVGGGASNRSSLLSSITARLTRPKKSSTTAPQTGGNTAGADAKQSSKRVAANGTPTTKVRQTVSQSISLEFYSGLSNNYNSSANNTVINLYFMQYFVNLSRKNAVTVMQKSQKVLLLYLG